MTQRYNQDLQAANRMQDRNASKKGSPILVEDVWLHILTFCNIRSVLATGQVRIDSLIMIAIDR